MEIQLGKIFSRSSHRPLLLLLMILICSIVYYSKNMPTKLMVMYIPISEPIYAQTPKPYKQLNIINLREDSKENCTCIKTKHLLHLVQTSICLHDDRDAISNAIQKEGIWEERYLIELFGVLIRYPQMSFIDVGANIGGYTMFAASFGRSVVSIECFKPNIENDPQGSTNRESSR